MIWKKVHSIASEVNSANILKTTGPAFDAKGADVAIESVDITHEVLAVDDDGEKN